MSFAAWNVNVNGERKTAAPSSSIFFFLHSFLFSEISFATSIRSVGSFPRDKESGQWLRHSFHSLYLYLYLDTPKASSKLGKRHVIKRAFQHLIIARRNLISNPFSAALFTAPFPPLQMYWFWNQIRSNLPSIAEKMWKDRKRKKKKKENRDALIMRLITFSSRERRKASLRFHYVSSLLVRGLAKILERILFRRESRRVCSKSRLLDNRYRCCFRRVKNHRCAIQPFYAPRFLSILFCFFFSFFLRATYAEFLGREEGSFFFFFLHYSISVSLHVNSAWISAILQLGREQL